jgi:hypothetical protein
MQNYNKNLSSVSAISTANGSTIKLGYDHCKALKILSVKAKITRQEPLRLNRCVASDQKISSDSISPTTVFSEGMP